MAQVNIHEAKTKLSQLVAAVESGAEAEVVIARDGKPVARIVPLTTAQPVERRLGLAKGAFGHLTLDDFNADDAEIAEMFNASPLEPRTEPAPKRRKAAV